MKKRLLAWLLALCMVIGMMPVTAVADGTADSEASESNGGSTIEWISVADAGALTSAVKDGAYIKLTADISSNITINSGCTVTLDLNGKKLSCADSVHTIRNLGTLTIQDSASDGAVINTSSNGYSAVANEGTLTISGGTFQAYGLAVWAYSGTATISNATVESTNFVAIKVQGGTTTINSSTVTGKGDVAVWSVGGTVIINGGTYTTENQDKNAVYVNGGTAEINGGEFTCNSSKHCIWLSSGAVNITGGTYAHQYVTNASIAAWCKSVYDPSNQKYHVVAVTEDKAIAQLGTGSDVKYFTSLASAVGYATGTEDAPAVITLLKDTTENVSSLSNKYITLDLNGKTLSSSTCILLSGGTLTINDSSADHTGKLTSTASNAAIVATGGAIVINGGTISDTNITSNHAIWIADNAVSLTITGGELVYSGNANDRVYHTGNRAEPTVTISGGTFSADPTYTLNSRSSIAAGYKAEEKDGKWIVRTLTDEEAEAKIGDVRYVAFTDAYDAVPVNGTATIVLLNDVTLDKAFDVSQGKSITLDLNGKKFTVESLQVQKGGPDTQYPSMKIEDNSDDQNGEVVLTGNSWTVGSGASLEISGGTFPFDVTSPNYVSKGCVVTYNTENDKYTVKRLTEKDATAKIGDTLYNTLNEALSAAQSGDTITMLRDESMTGCYGLTKAMTIDLNGHILTGPSSNWAFYLSGDAAVEVKNGTINAYNGFYCSTGKLTLTNVELTASGTAIYMYTNSQVTVGKDSEVSSSNNGTTIQIWNSTGTFSQPVVKVYGTVENTGSGSAILGNGSDKVGTVINIYEGAKVTADNSMAIYHPQPGTLTISGGEVSGEAAIGMKSGTLTISGGTIKGTKNSTSLSDSDSSGNGIAYDGSAIVIDSNVAYAGSMNVFISDDAKVESAYSTAIREIGSDSGKTNVVSINISGGTVSGGAGMDVIKVRDVTKKTVSITGGKFSSDVTEYCASGLATVKSGDYYTVAQKQVTVTENVTITATNTTTSGDKTKDNAATEKITEAVAKPNVANYATDNTGAKSEEAVKAALVDASKPSDSGSAAITTSDIKSYTVNVQTTPTAVEYKTGDDNAVTVTKVVYDVKTIATATVNENTYTAELNDLDKVVTFRLAVPDDWAGKAAVTHQGDTRPMGYYTVLGDENGKYVEVSNDQFSTYTVEQIADLPEGTLVASVGDTYYDVLQDAVDAALKQDKPLVLLKKITSDDEITIPEGKTLTVDRNGFIWAAEKKGNGKVVFSDAVTGTITAQITTGTDRISSTADVTDLLAGDEITVSVSSDVAFYGAYITLKYDPKVLELTSDGGWTEDGTGTGRYYYSYNATTTVAAGTVFGAFEFKVIEQSAEVNTVIEITQAQIATSVDDAMGGAGAAEFKVANAAVRVYQRTALTVPPDFSLTYTGKEQTSGLSDETWYTVSEKTKATNVGDKGEVQLTITDANLYYWSGVENDPATVTVKFSIIQANNSWTTEPKISGKTYNGEAISVTTEPDPKFGTATVKYYNGDNELSAAPTNAGSYKAVFAVEETNNYKGLEKTVTFAISKATINDEWYNAPTELSTAVTYNGKSQALINPASSKNVEGAPTLTFSYSINSGEYSAEGYKSDAAAGTYTVTCKISAENYTDKEKAFTVTVNAPDYAVVATEYVTGYKMVYVFTNADDIKFSYTYGKNTWIFYDISTIGYTLYKDSSDNYSLTTGNAIEGMTHVYACLLSGEAASDNNYSASNVSYTATKLKGTVTYSTGVSEDIRKYDVNGSNSVGIEDAVAICATANIGNHQDYLTDYMKTVIRADVDKNGVIEVAKDAIEIKDICQPIKADDTTTD